MRIQNNITAMNTHRQYTINNENVAKNAEKLSSGYRINRAGDDAAGLAISEKMRSQIRGLNMATKNSQDAISLVQTAEGALQETQNMLQRMNELAVQAATGTNESLDRTALAKEFEQLKREINDIAEQTTFNNMKVLDGSMSYKGYARSAATAGVTFTEQTNIINSPSDPKSPNEEPEVLGATATGPNLSADATATTPQDGEKLQVKLSYKDTNGDPKTVTFEAAGDDAKNVKTLINGMTDKDGWGIEMKDNGDIVVTATGDPQIGENEKVTIEVGITGTPTGGGGATALKTPSADLKKEVAPEIITDETKTDGGQALTLADEEPAADKPISGVFGTVTTVATPAPAETDEDGTETTAATVGKWTATVDLSKLEAGDFVSVNAGDAITLTANDLKTGDAFATALNAGLPEGVTVAASTDSEGNVTLTFTGKADGTGPDSISLAASRAAEDDNSGNDNKLTGLAGEIEATQVDNGDGTSTVTVSGLENLQQGDQFKIGDKVFEVTDKDGNRVNNTPQLLAAGTTDDPILVTPGADGKVTNDIIAKAINDAKIDGVSAKVENGKLTVTGAKEKIVLQVPDADGKLQTIEVDGDEDDNKKTTSANTKDVTFEIDFAKLKEGDQVTITVDGLDEPITIDGPKAGTSRDTYFTNLKTQLAGITGTNKDGSTFSVEVKGNSIIMSGMDLGADIDTELTTDATMDGTKQAEGYTTNALRIQVGALENEQLNVSIDAMTTMGLGIDDAHLTVTGGTTEQQQDAAGAAITAVRNAINKVSDQRATLGAMQNRLDHKIANLKVASENLSASESRIRDVDMASEMTQFTKNNILSQAATAMLAQANALPQNVLSLLG